jgi:hypothetical protein
MRAAETAAVVAATLGSCAQALGTNAHSESKTKQVPYRKIDFMLPPFGQQFGCSMRRLSSARNGGRMMMALIFAESVTYSVI